MSVASLPESSHEVSRDELIQKLSGENQALQSMLYGLCMGLAQMSDVHREVVAQAFEYAYGAPRTSHPGLGEWETMVREQGFRSAISGLKEAVTGRFRRM